MPIKLIVVEERSCRASRQQLVEAEMQFDVTSEVDVVPPPFGCFELAEIAGGPAGCPRHF
jgi:hypothetical protein